MEHLLLIFERLREFGLCINLAKCEFAKSELQFLGYLVTSLGLKPLPEKVNVINNYELPGVAKELKRFLAMVNFYRRFIPKAVNNQIHLQKLIKGNEKNDNTKIEWDAETINFFNLCKADLAENTLLAYQARDAELSLCVYASDFAMGAVLHQSIDGESLPLGFYSKKFTGGGSKEI